MIEYFRNRLRAARRFYYSIGLASSKAFTQPQAERDALRAFSMVVAVHDAPDVTALCFDSLERYCTEADVIVVDDGSRDEATRRLIDGAIVRNNWRLIRNDIAKGHSRACEMGAALSTRDYLCLLNSDTYVTPWGWQAIRNIFETDAAVAVVGPSTSWAATRQRQLEALHCRHSWTTSQIVGYAERHIKKNRLLNDETLEEISGFAFFIRRKVWQAFDGFASELTDYGNETDLCRRLANAGHKLVWTRRAYIHHFGEQSYSQLGEEFIETRKAEIRSIMDQYQADAE